MKDKTKLQKAIIQFEIVCKTYELTPSQFRYCCKTTRNHLNLKVPQNRLSLPDYLNPAEIYTLIEKAYTKDFSIGVLCDFQIKTGLRINETTELLIEHIDFGNNQLKVVNGKGGKDRIVPLSNNLKKQLLIFIGQRRKGYLFCKYNETQYTKRALQKKIELIIKDCHFQKHITTHGLRHTFACMCLARGLPLEQIQIIMGHNSITTTQIYAKIELSTVKENFIRLLE